MHALYGIFIALFMAMLALPLMFVDFSTDRVSVQENRMLANPPAPADIKNQPDVFIRHFDEWFKDSIGFRKQLITLYDVMGKNAWYNGIRYTDGQYIYLIGEEGHHYFAANGNLIRKFQGKEFLTDNELTNMTAKLKEVKIYLEKKGIPFIVMFCTDKESIYPEFYPKLIKRGLEPIQLDIITKRFQEHIGADVFNIREALVAEKDNFMLYVVSSGDLSHYNEIGGFFAYRELMKHINIYFPEIIPYELSDIDISYDKNGIPIVSLKAETTFKELEKSFFDDVNVFRPFSWENQAFENREPALPKILFFRDSYAGWSGGKYLTNYIPQHFGKAIFIHSSAIEYFKEHIDKYKPDIVVLESGEWVLPNFSNWIADKPNLP